MEARFKSKAMYAACLMNVAALGIYSLFPGLEGMIAALILLGLSASFGKPVQQDYYLGLMPCRRFGEDRAIGIYNFTENIGESLGPILFGQLMSATPFAPAMAGFLAAVTGTNGLHLWLNRRDLSD